MSKGGNGQTRMRIAFRIFLPLCFPVFLSCATEHVSEPDELPIPPRNGFLTGTSVDIAIFDGRTNQEASNALKDSINRVIAKAYPSAKVTRLEDAQYYSDPFPNHVTVKIAIAAYGSGFGSKVAVGAGTFGGKFAVGVVAEGQWNGLTGFLLSVYDNRLGQDKKLTKTIRKLFSASNTFGYMTANSVLADSYKAAMLDTLSFVDQSLMK